MTLETADGAIHICAGMCLDKKRHYYAPYLFYVKSGESIRNPLTVNGFIDLLECAAGITLYQVKHENNGYEIRIITPDELSEHIAPMNKVLENLQQDILTAMMDKPEYVLAFTRIDKYAHLVSAFPEEYDLSAKSEYPEYISVLDSLDFETDNN